MRRGECERSHPALQGPPRGSTKSKLRICFTCRHYPIQDWDYGFEICVEHENSQDISTYVQAQLSRHPGRITPPLLQKITQRASGLFIWVRLVINQVLDLDLEEDLTKMETKIKKTIESVPQDLDELYLGLIHSVDEPSASLKLIEWILCAREPLTLRDLRCAMAVDFDSTCKASIVYRRRGVKDRTAMQRRVRMLSRGLAETVATSFGKDKEQVQFVQFIHQSVKDFFHDKGLLALSLRAGTPCGTADLAVRVAHFKLSASCLRALAMDAIDALLNPNHAMNRRGVTPRVPFLPYAARHWMTHARRMPMDKRTKRDFSTNPGGRRNASCSSGGAFTGLY